MSEQNPLDEILEDMDNALMVLMFLIESIRQKDKLGQDKFNEYLEPVLSGKNYLEKEFQRHVKLTQHILSMLTLSLEHSDGDKEPFEQAMQEAEQYLTLLEEKATSVLDGYNEMMMLMLDKLVPGTTKH